MMVGLPDRVSMRDMHKSVSILCQKKRSQKQSLRIMFICKWWQNIRNIDCITIDPATTMYRAVLVIREQSQSENKLITGIIVQHC